MTQAIFVDSSAWIAVSDVRGKYHQQAVQYYELLIRDRINLVTTNFVIAESYVMIQKTAGITKAILFLDVLRTSRLIRRIYSNESLELVAESILRQYSDQDFSYADAVSFAFMRQERIDNAFAFDHHFTVAGFETAPR